VVAIGATSKPERNRLVGQRHGPRQPVLNDVLLQGPGGGKTKRRRKQKESAKKDKVAKRRGGWVIGKPTLKNMWSQNENALGAG